MTDKYLAPLYLRGVFIFLFVLFIFSCSEKQRSTLPKEEYVKAQESIPLTVSTPLKEDKEIRSLFKGEAKAKPEIENLKKEDRKKINKKKIKEVKKEPPKPPNIRIFKILNVNLYGDVFFKVLSVDDKLNSLSCVLVVNSLKNVNVPCKGIVKYRLVTAGNHTFELFAKDGDGFIANKKIDFKVKKKCGETKELLVKDLGCYRNKRKCSLKLFFSKERLVEIKDVNVLLKGKKLKPVKVCVKNRCRRKLPLTFRVKGPAVENIKVILPKAEDELKLMVDLEVNMKKERISCEIIL